MGLWRLKPRRSPFPLAFGLAASVVSVSWGMPAPAANGASPLLQRIQAPGADAERVAVAGERLIVHAAPSGRSRIVNHVEKNDQVIVVETQSPWAKIEDYQTGRVLGWVYSSLLLAPGG